MRLKIDQQEHQISTLQDKLNRKLEEQTDYSKKDSIDGIVAARMSGEIIRIQEVYEDVKRAEVEAEKLKFVLGTKERDILVLKQTIEALQIE